MNDIEQGERDGWCMYARSRHVCSSYQYGSRFLSMIPVDMSTRVRLNVGNVGLWSLIDSQHLNIYKYSGVHERVKKFCFLVRARHEQEKAILVG